jgi:hypothetical protein
LFFGMIHYWMKDSFPRNEAPTFVIVISLQISGSISGITLIANRRELFLQIIPLCSFLVGLVGTGILIGFVIEKIRSPEPYLIVFSIIGALIFFHVSKSLGKKHLDTHPDRQIMK